MRAGVNVSGAVEAEDAADEAAPLAGASAFFCPETGVAKTSTTGCAAGVDSTSTKGPPSAALTGQGMGAFVGGGVVVVAKETGDCGGAAAAAEAVAAASAAEAAAAAAAEPAAATE
mmetsp:Transcript_5127/g.12599  ORF Transcript_5127/g.12599 Transcript_5127/m.12599 type:complete len:116 (+) Transcript_5127:874-1221(+)